MRCNDEQSNTDARDEIEILTRIYWKGGDRKHIVKFYEAFIHKVADREYICMVFESLGKSLYEFMRLSPNPNQVYSLTQI